MDSARIRRRISSPPQLPSTGLYSQQRSDTSDFAVENDVFEPDASPSRRQRLLNNRHAHFPGKKLSLTGISNKFNQLIGKNEQPTTSAAPSRHQENTALQKSKSTGTIGKRASLGVLEEYNNSGRSHPLRRREEIPIYQDHAEILDRSSPLISSPYIDPLGEFNSPLGFDNIQDNLSDMRLRELSLNVDWSPAVKSPPPRSKSLRRADPIAFDTDDYIEHIEKELQQTRDEAYSPLTRRPVREKLRAANKENERLQKELAQLREKFETEVKKTVEHKTLAELELRRKVKDLEELLEDKEHAIRELQYQHEERRLDNNIIASLKATIDRLEQDKVDMEQINLGMSKRNEVLTQLLAMSPTKLADGFQLRSPVREKRNARPISLILPRQSASPSSNHYTNSASAIGSPHALADISPFKLSPDEHFPVIAGRQLQSPLITPQHEEADPLRKVPSPEHRSRSRRSTLQSDISLSSASNNGISAFLSDERQTRRKARRFMAGSTQLKPLLLPSMAGEAMTLSSASTISSPRSWKAEVPCEADVDDTILPDEDMQVQARDDLVAPEIFSNPQLIDDVVDDGPGPAEHNTDTKSSIVNSPNIPSVPVKLQAPGTELSVEHLKMHDSQYSLHTMPIPETPESLIARPQPLFSDNRSTHHKVTRLPSGSPYLPSNSWEVSVQKKRKNSFGTHDISSPASKIQCSRELECSPAEIDTPQVPRDPTTPSSATSANKRLSQIRTTDNFVDLLRQRNFAARPLAALTIRTVYTLLSTCTSAVRNFRRDPFALARRLLANAWRANWKVFGKVSWWVLGLFIQPEAKCRARAAIDWDQFDGESIASRYCSSTSQNSDLGDARPEQPEEISSQPQDGHSLNDDPSTETSTGKAGWGSSMYLWGKFSAALMLAISGAVIKGPKEMLKDVEKDADRTKRRHKSYKSCSRRDKHENRSPTRLKTPQLHHNTERKMAPTQTSIADSPYTSNFDFRYQLKSSSLLGQIQQPDYDSTLRPETATRGRLGSLFSPTSSPGELAERLQDLRLSSATESANTPQTPQPGTYFAREEG